MVVVQSEQHFRLGVYSTLIFNFNGEGGLQDMSGKTIVDAAYISASTNRYSQAADSRNSLVVYGSSTYIALWDTSVCYSTSDWFLKATYHIRRIFMTAVHMQLFPGMTVLLLAFGFNPIPQLSAETITVF